MNTREVPIIITVAIVLAFVISLVSSADAFLIALLTILTIILINIFAKKITAYLLETKIEIKLWEMKRWGFKPHKHFEKPLPIGVLLPIVLVILSYGYIVWLASLVFNVKQKVSRSAKKWGLYNFSEVTEWHTGVIAAWGVIANLVFAFIGYLVGFPEFSRLNIYFAFFNLLPFSDLDGNKIFFGSIILWSFLAAVTLIALGYSFLIV